MRRKKTPASIVRKVSVNKYRKRELIFGKLLSLRVLWIYQSTKLELFSTQDSSFQLKTIRFQFDSSYNLTSTKKRNCHRAQEFENFSTKRKRRSSSTHFFVSSSNKKYFSSNDYALRLLLIFSSIKKFSQNFEQIHGKVSWERRYPYCLKMEKTEREKC